MGPRHSPFASDMGMLFARPSAFAARFPISSSLEHRRGDGATELPGHSCGAGIAEAGRTGLGRPRRNRPSLGHGETSSALSPVGSCIDSADLYFSNRTSRRPASPWKGGLASRLCHYRLSPSPSVSWLRQLFSVPSTRHDERGASDSRVRLAAPRAGPLYPSHRTHHL